MFNIPCVSCVPCHISHVLCHVSHVSCDVLHVTYKGWLVCYQRALPFLVLIIMFQCKALTHIKLFSLNWPLGRISASMQYKRSILYNLVKVKDYQNLCANCKLGDQRLTFYFKSEMRERENFERDTNMNKDFYCKVQSCFKL